MSFPTFNPSVLNLGGQSKQQQLNLLNLVIDDHHSKTRRSIAGHVLATISAPEGPRDKRPKADLDRARRIVANCLASTSNSDDKTDSKRSERQQLPLPGFSRLDTSTSSPQVVSVINALTSLEEYNKFASMEKARLIRLIELDQPLNSAAAPAPARRMSTGTVQQAPPLARRSTEPRTAALDDSRKKYAVGPQQSGANMVPFSGPRRSLGSNASGRAESPDLTRNRPLDDENAGRRQNTGNAVDPRQDPRRR